MSAASTVSCNVHNEEKTLHILYLGADGKENSFWKLHFSFMQAVAKSLKINLTIKIIDDRSRNRFFLSRFIADTLRESHHYDAVIGPMFSGTEKAVLDIFEQYNLPYFSVNTSLVVNSVEKVGLPRQKYKYWIGHMSPNDQLGGYDLTRFLIHGMKKEPHVIAVAAGLGSAVSSNRLNGLKDAAHDANLYLSNIYHSDWSYESAMKLASAAINREPGGNVFFGGSDVIARGIISALKATGRRLNQDVRVGAFDWSSENLQLLIDKQLYVAYGGHFLEGGWVLILLYDYFHQVDFFDELGGNISTVLNPLHQGNLADYQHRILNHDWSGIDFKQHTKCHNTELKSYRFSPEIIKIIHSG